MSKKRKEKKENLFKIKCLNELKMKCLYLNLVLIKLAVLVMSGNVPFKF